MASELTNRRLSTAITLVVLVGLLVAGAVFGLRALFSPVSDDAVTSPGPTCTPTKVVAGGRIRARDVTISVFNAGDRAGLANDTLDALSNRGFKAGDAGNAPEGTRVRFVQVWTDDKTDQAARLVALQFGRKTVVRIGEDLGVGVDVVVGSQFRGLVRAPTSIRSRGQEEVCVEE